MAKRKPANLQDLILTTFGTDGAASAAAVLLACPQAVVDFTSAGRVADKLYSVAEGKAAYANLYVCGVGISDNLHEVLQALCRLAAMGIQCVWLCGRGYMDEYQPQLEEFCQCVFSDCVSNTACVLDHFAPSINDKKQTEMLLKLADEFVGKSEAVDDIRLWWHDFIRASAGRFFKYDEQTPFIDAIRKLAGLQDVDESDRREVDLWRKGEGKSQPLGSSKAMKSLRQLISRLGAVEQPVLVLGPSGAGKEMVARLLHEASSRRGGPFIPVNCAVLSSNSDMAHDRLFGHVAGAYTGARASAPGAFEAAEGGTLFLDEVGELPVSVQTQLLRALQEKEISPLGTVQTRRVDVRIVAATNRNLAVMVREGSFRLDLYHRLNVLQLTVPSLTERKEDIRSIAKAEIHTLQQEGYLLKLSAADWNAALDYDWPGNIRQLVNLLRRAAYMGLPLRTVIARQLEEDRLAEKLLAGQGGIDIQMTGSDLPETLQQVRPLEEIRREYVSRVFKLCEGSTQKAAQLLGVSANTIRALRK